VAQLMHWLHESVAWQRRQEGAAVNCSDQ